MKKLILLLLSIFTTASVSAVDVHFAIISYKDMENLNQRTKINYANEADNATALNAIRKFWNLTLEKFPKAAPVEFEGSRGAISHQELAREDELATKDDLEWILSAHHFKNTYQGIAISIFVDDYDDQTAATILEELNHAQAMDLD